MSAAADAPSEPGRDWVEIVSTVLLALAAVATAWSSYQATRWNGEQTKATSRANASRIEATRAAALADSQTEIDVATFIQWVDAAVTGEADLKTFYEQRFRPEFKPAFAAWQATRPLTNADAPPTPFAMPEYRLAARQDAAQKDATSEALAAAARVDVQRAANYVLAVVLFAVALFFAGMSAKLRSKAPRTALLVVGGVVFVGALAWITTFPISVSV